MNIHQGQQVLRRQFREWQAYRNLHQFITLDPHRMSMRDYVIILVPASEEIAVLDRAAV
jgi:hypothetical protein